MIKHILTLYYSVQNGGDGSAYPAFFDSMELAELDQDTMDEGWGESCTGSIELESDSPITVTYPTIQTKEKVIKETEGEMKYNQGQDKWSKSRLEYLNEKLEKLKSL